MGWLACFLTQLKSLIGYSMNKRALVAGLTLLLVGGYIKATDTGYTMKVAQVSHTTGDIEVKFVTVPEDFRLLCHGDTRKFNTGDYVKIETGNGDIHFGAVKCQGAIWVK